MPSSVLPPGESVAGILRETRLEPCYGQRDNAQGNNRPPRGLSGDRRRRRTQSDHAGNNSLSARLARRRGGLRARTLGSRWSSHRKSSSPCSIRTAKAERVSSATAISLR